MINREAKGTLVASCIGIQLFRPAQDAMRKLELSHMTRCPQNIGQCIDIGQWIRIFQQSWYEFWFFAEGGLDCCRILVLQDDQVVAASQRLTLFGSGMFWLLNKNWAIECCLHSL